MGVDVQGSVSEPGPKHQIILGTLDKEIPQVIVIVECAGAPFGNDINTKPPFKYSCCFKNVKGKRGVYIFQEKSTGQVLYVGRGGFGNKHCSRDLKDRVEQHYRQGDSSGGFHENWAKVHCSECKDRSKCTSGGNCKFPDYLKLIDGSRIIFFCIDGPVEQARQQAIELERKLGQCLSSKYSSHG